MDHAALTAMEGRRLTVAVDAVPLFGPRTGIGVFTAEVLGGLARRPDVEPRAFAVTWRQRHRLPGLLPAGVRAVTRPMPARPLWWLWSRAPAPPIEAFTGPVDVVHGPNFVVPPARRAAAVVTVHDLTAVHFPELCQPATRRYPELIRTAVRRGAWVHTVSAFVAGEVEEHLGVPPERIRVVHNGVSAPPVPVPAGSPAPASAPVSPGPAGGERFVLALATVEPRKDLPGLVAAFDRLADADPDVRLVLAGPDGWGAAALSSALAAARHGDRIRRLGWVSDEQRAALLASASVLAFPSRYEGFGLPVLEAMAAGLPVVATAVGAVPEVAGPAARLVPPGDVDALAGALAAVLDDDAEADRLRRLGHDRVRRFSWERTVDGLVALYRDARAASR